MKIFISFPYTTTTLIISKIKFIKVLNGVGNGIHWLFDHLLVIILALKVVQYLHRAKIDYFGFISIINLLFAVKLRASL